MKTEHTPGPWHSSGVPFKPMDRDRIKAGYRAFGIGNGADHIGYASITGCVPEHVALANAALICSAPSLLAENARLRDLISRAEPMLRSVTVSLRSMEFHSTADIIGGLASDCELEIARSTEPEPMFPGDIDAPTVAAKALAEPAVDPRDVEITRLRSALGLLVALLENDVHGADTRCRTGLNEARAALKGGGL